MLCGPLFIHFFLLPLPPPPYPGSSVNIDLMIQSRKSKKTFVKLFLMFHVFLNKKFADSGERVST